MIGPGICAQGHGQGQTPVKKGRYKRLDEAGVAAQPNDEPSVRTLLDEVFNFPSYLQVPPGIDIMVKERLLRAELAHRNGHSQGVEEQSIADALNMVADKLGTPAEAKTSAKQIRYLRMHLLLGEPNFMGMGLARPVNIGGSIKSTMSPFQAAHLIMVLVNQKFGGDDSYLVPPDQWDQNFDHKVKSLYIPESRALGDPQQGFQPPAQTTPQPPGPRLIVKPAPSVLVDVLNSVSKGISDMSDADGLKLLHDVFSKMGM